MFSRAHLLIEKEMREVNSEPDMSINKLNENSLFELVAYIQGLPNSAWKNGVFKINMKFTERYNHEPPKVIFQTIPYHPNIDEKTGRPSLDFLDEPTKWKINTHNIKHILKSLQYLLANPYLDRSVNMGAVFLLKDNPQEFESIIRESVLASQKLIQQQHQQISNSQLSSSNQSVKFRKYIRQSDSNNVTIHKLYEINDENQDEYLIKEYIKFQEKTKPFKNISFEEYINLWRGIATTKVNTREENVYLKSNAFENPAILFQHLSISLKDLEREVYKQLTEHKNLMYGNFNFSNGKLFNNKNINFDSNHNNENLDPINEVKTSIIGSHSLNDENFRYDNKKSFNETMFNISSGNLNHINNQNLKTPSPELIKVTASIKKASSSKLTDHNPVLPVDDDEKFEEEVDALINWTKTI